jgi:biotin transport system ATP-binding protein/energy-coupling factor transport system ATP-binding protein
MIKVKNLNYYYDKQGSHVLRDINFEFTRGKYIVIIGPNGCGKTTFIRHFNGLLVPTSGDVWVGKNNTKDTNALRDIRQKVGMVFQNPDNQIVGMSVEEDVAFGPGNLGLPSEELRTRVKESLSLVGMTGYTKKAPHMLSNGEKQLIAIAGVLAMKPEYIVLDEPTSYLDPLGRKRVTRFIKELNTSGITIIHVTHNMDEAVSADMVIVMDKGQIIRYGKPKEIFAHPLWLKELGLELPIITELIWRLRDMGADIRTDIMTMDTACAELSSLLK